ncbi:hypothetical protein NMY22_g15473 [Coprinellus aureogranulatus]|nr:hypothetical protein NMY22_g15473 [Coprinellus aureogranulatus]
MAEQQVLTNVELTSMVFQFLKEITLKDTGIHITFDNITKTNIEWTSQFAQLATVNRAFFEASITVLWERMESVTPFLAYVLPANRGEDRKPLLPLTYQGNTLGIEEWKRFSIYSSRTKTLGLLSQSSPAISSGWLSCIQNSKDRPSTLFPSLKRVFMGSNDAASAYIVGGACSGLEYISIMLHADGTTPQEDVLDAAKALTFSLSQNSSTLNQIRLLSPVSESIIHNISMTQALGRLHVTVGRDMELCDLGRLAGLPRLRSLRIQQSEALADLRVADEFPDSVDIHPIISAAPNFDSLVTLRVVGDGTTQFLVASWLRPRNLKKLKLQLCTDGLNTQMVLVPLVIAMYLQGNQGLETLKAYCSSSYSSVRRQALTPFRNDARFKQTDFLLETLSKLPSLNHLEISNIPFLSTDIVPRILATILGHRKLRQLLLHPANFTDLDTDKIVLPPLKTLQDLCDQNPSLTAIEMPIQLDQGCPDLPISFLSHHPLEALTLHSHSTMQFDQRTMEDKFKLGQYLERLFPSVRVTCPPTARPEGVQFWEFIDQYISHSRATRAHTLHHSTSSQSPTAP